MSSYYILYYTGRLEEVDFERYVQAFNDPAVVMLVEEET